jgi:hypothetical protein
MGATHTQHRMVMHRTPHGGIRTRTCVRDHASRHDRTPRAHDPFLARFDPLADAGRFGMVGVEDGEVVHGVTTFFVRMSCRQ